MNRRLLRALLALYPRAWRDRYGAEVAHLTGELIAAGETTPLAGALNLMAGGSPSGDGRWPDPGVSRWPWRPPRSWPWPGASSPRLMRSPNPRRPASPASAVRSGQGLLTSHSSRPD